MKPGTPPQGGVFLWGRRTVLIDAAGKAIAAGISGSRTRVTMDGKPADRSAIKVGMTCRVTLSSPGAKEATAVDCKG